MARISEQRLEAGRELIAVPLGALSGLIVSARWVWVWMGW